MKKFISILFILSTSVSFATSMRNNQDTTAAMAHCDEMMMAPLNQTSATYDEDYINLMIKHQELGIEMAKNALKNSTHFELKEMAKQIITHQEKEIELLKTWRKQWYGK